MDVYYYIYVTKKQKPFTWKRIIRTGTQAYLPASSTLESPSSTAQSSEISEPSSIPKIIGSPSDSRIADPTSIPNISEKSTSNGDDSVSQFDLNKQTRRVPRKQTFALTRSSPSPSVITPPETPEKATTHLLGRKRGRKPKPRPESATSEGLLSSPSSAPILSVSEPLTPSPSSDLPPRLSPEPSLPTEQTRIHPLKQSPLRKSSTVSSLKTHSDNQSSSGQAELPRPSASAVRSKLPLKKRSEGWSKSVRSAKAAKRRKLNCEEWNEPEKKRFFSRVLHSFVRQYYKPDNENDVYRFFLNQLIVRLKLPELKDVLNRTKQLLAKSEEQTQTGASNPDNVALESLKSDPVIGLFGEKFDGFPQTGTPPDLAEDHFNLMLDELPKKRRGQTEERLLLEYSLKRARLAYLTSLENRPDASRTDNKTEPDIQMDMVSSTSETVTSPSKPAPELSGSSSHLIQQNSTPEASTSNTPVPALKDSREDDIICLSDDEDDEIMVVKEKEEEVKKEDEDIEIVDSKMTMSWILRSFKETPLYVVSIIEQPTAHPYVLGEPNCAPVPLDMEAYFGSQEEAKREKQEEKKKEEKPSVPSSYIIKPSPPLSQMRLPNKNFNNDSPQTKVSTITVEPSKSNSTQPSDNPNKGQDSKTKVSVAINPESRSANLEARSDNPDSSAFLQKSIPSLNNAAEVETSKLTQVSKTAQPISNQSTSTIVKPMSQDTKPSEPLLIRALLTSQVSTVNPSSIQVSRDVTLDSDSILAIRPGGTSFRVGTILKPESAVESAKRRPSLVDSAQRSSGEVKQDQSAARRISTNSNPGEVNQAVNANKAVSASKPADPEVVSLSDDDDDLICLS